MYPFTFYDLLARNLEANAANEALAFGEETLTYAELERLVEPVAAWMSAHGVRRGDRVGVHLPRGFEEVVATFAAARLGAAFVTVHRQQTVSQLEYIVNDCGVKALVVDARRARELAAAGIPGHVEGVLVVGDAPADPPGGPRFTALSDIPPAACPRQRVVGPDLAAILYTSGSTGMPKGVMLSNTNLVQGALSVATYLENTPEDRVLGHLSFSFDYGLSQLTTMFLVGGTVVLHGVPMASEILRTVERHRVTGIATVSPIWIEIVRYLQESPSALPHLRYVTNTGGAIPPNVLDALPEVFPQARIFLMYGLTEAFRSTFLPPELYHGKKGSIGKAIPGNEVYVVDEQHGVCGPGQQGELVHRGPLVSMGYWGRERETAEKIKPCPQLAHLIGDEKVCYSGDTVRVDEDGFLWYVGRSDSMIKCNAVRVSPTEIEQAVCASGLVKDAVAFGVDDPAHQQVVHVAVTTYDGTDVTEDAVILYCRKNMPPYMVPVRVYVWEGEPMPKTASGKLDRPRIIAMSRG